MIAARSTWGAISLSNSTFAGNRQLHDSKAAGVAARPREVLDEAAPNRVSNDDKNDGDGALLLQH